MLAGTYRYVVIAALILGVGIACATQGTDGGGELMAMGETVFEEQCARCHGSDGEGTSGVPELAGNAAVTGEPDAVIETILQGPGTMPSFGGRLNDEEIAAVSTYVRNTWGNDASAISADDVAAAR